MRSPLQSLKIQLTIPENLSGLRLDQALSQLLPEYSRTQITHWIKEKKIFVDGKTQRPKYLVKTDEVIELDVTLSPAVDWTQAEAIDLTVAYEDEAVLVVNKPVGLVTHPAPGNPSHTLVNALLHYHPALAQLPRAGIIHRLDKDTSGLLIIGKTLLSHQCLLKQMQARFIQREYDAIVQGLPISGGTINSPIARHSIHRKKMTLHAMGKPAITHYRIHEKFRYHTWLKVKLETGRTHQIRVHLASIQHPIIGDQTYGKKWIPKNLSLPLQEVLKHFSHQALHASTLSFSHPISDEWITVTAALPDDMIQLISVLRAE